MPSAQAAFRFFFHPRPRNDESKPARFRVSADRRSIRALVEPPDANADDLMIRSHFRITNLPPQSDRVARRFPFRGSSVTSRASWFDGKTLERARRALRRARPVGAPPSSPPPTPSLLHHAARHDRCARVPSPPHLPAPHPRPRPLPRTDRSRRGIDGAPIVPRARSPPAPTPPRAGPPGPPPGASPPPSRPPRASSPRGTHHLSLTLLASSRRSLARLPPPPPPPPTPPPRGGGLFFFSRHRPLPSPAQVRAVRVLLVASAWATPSSSR